MAKCAFFGHRDLDYTIYGDKIDSILRDLIVGHNVTEFYSGNRGSFDVFCKEMVWTLKNEFPQIQSKLVLSYLPRAVRLPPHFDSAIYLLDRKVSPKAAIIETNQLLVNNVDFIVSGVNHESRGSYKAIEYAIKKGKTVISIFK